MEIRKGTPEDIPAIVEVLRASLGEDDLPLSEKIWNFKHIENPFGQSIILLATEGNSILGVRAFMRWHWQKDSRTFSCLRAVDTATHPEHQGKGIFKKLTLGAVELAKEEGVDFIFNTPNDKSRPGYLKMGWKVAGKLNVAVSPAFLSFYKLNKSSSEYQVTYKTSFSEIEKLCIDWNNQFAGKGLYTPKTLKYLKWRYEENPLQKYEVLATSSFYLAGYIKRRNRIKELRIVECIKAGNEGDNEIKKSIKSWSSKFNAQFVSFSPLVSNLKLLSVKGKFGPLATVRNLNLSQVEREECFTVDNWTYSLGDLELF